LHPKSFIPFKWIVCCAVLVSQAAFAQSSNETALRKELDGVKAQVQALKTEVDELKTTLRDLTTPRPNPVFDVTGAPAMGDAKARVVLIEFSDYQCPYCLDYFKTTYRKIVDEYVNSGKIRYVVRDFPGESIHPDALKAAEAARCATEQGKFWPMHDSLFANQRTLGTTGIYDSATSVGLNIDQFRACVDSEKHVAGIRKDEDETTKLGAKGTPAFFIGTVDPANPSKVKLAKALIGSQPITAFQQVFDSLLPKQ
jgi:protein-disulfide isomerase